ncbi:MAG TPA: hypothetical protein VFC48_00905 [Cellulomonas sp.]|nr:hypothetical protein [Cellulomonas sp.]
MGAVERAERARRADLLRPTELARPAVLVLRAYQVGHAPGGGENECERVLGDGAVVQTATVRDHDVGREPGVEDRVGTRRERLHPAQPGESPCAVRELGGRVHPHDERSCVGELGRDG